MPTVKKQSRRGGSALQSSGKGGTEIKNKVVKKTGKIKIKIKTGKIKPKSKIRKSIKRKEVLDLSPKKVELDLAIEGAQEPELSQERIQEPEQDTVKDAAEETAAVLDEIKSGLKDGQAVDASEDEAAKDGEEDRNSVKINLMDEKEYLDKKEGAEDEDGERREVLTEKDAEIINPAKEPASGGDRRPSLSLYRKIAFSFIILTFILLGAVFYFAFVKVSITLIPNQERVGNNLIVDIYNQAAAVSGNSVKGTVEGQEVEKTKAYSASGELMMTEGLDGWVTIINNYGKSQPLVANTRLLSPDNKLFRIKETVRVPAGGSVRVEIYADEPGPEMALSPTKFTIPGLWAGLQDKIYAENEEPFQYQQKVQKYITQPDINRAVKDLKNELLAEAKKELSGDYQNYDYALYDIDNNSISIALDGKAGEEKDEFSVTIKTGVAVVAFNKEPIAKLAKEKLTASLPANKELFKFNQDKVVYSLNSYNIEEGVATINASFEGMAVLRSDAPIIDKSKLLGLTKTQLAAYLGALPEIASFEIKFTPGFIKKAPKLVDRIEVEIRR